MLVAALMVAAVVLQSPGLRFLPARGAAFGNEAAAGLGHADCRAVLPDRPGQTSDLRVRWEPTPGAPWVCEPEGAAPVGERACRVGVERGGPAGLLLRSRICRWLI